jgi:hypothetical protein
MKRNQARRRLVALSAAGVVGATVIVLAVAGASSSQPAPTFGTIPVAVLEAGEAVPASDLPDYIVAWDRDGNVAGYVAARYVWPILGQEDALGSDEAIPVVDTEFDIVGHMVPGVGFVPLGVDPRTVPPFVVTTMVEGAGDTSG